MGNDEKNRIRKFGILPTIAFAISLFLPFMSFQCGNLEIKVYPYKLITEPKKYLPKNFEEIKSSKFTLIYIPIISSAFGTISFFSNKLWQAGFLISGTISSVSLLSMKVALKNSTDRKKEENLKILKSKISTKITYSTGYYLMLLSSFGFLIIGFLPTLLKISKKLIERN